MPDYKTSEGQTAALGGVDALIALYDAAPDMGGPNPNALRGAVASVRRDPGLSVNAQRLFDKVERAISVELQERLPVAPNVLQSRRAELKHQLRLLHNQLTEDVIRAQRAAVSEHHS